jgi:hypothetical protein
MAPSASAATPRAAEAPSLHAAPARPTATPQAATNDQQAPASLHAAQTGMTAGQAMRKGAESDMEKDATGNASDDAADGMIGAASPRMRKAASVPPVPERPSLSAPLARPAALPQAMRNVADSEEDDAVGAASPRKPVVASIRSDAEPTLHAAPEEPIADDMQAQTLAGMEPDRIKGLPSDRFRVLLTATPWGALTIEQLDVIDADERLSVIANEVLTNMATGSLGGSDEDLSEE